MSSEIDVEASGFDPADPAFIADPYPVYHARRDLGPVLYYPPRDVHVLTRFADVNAALRDRRLGREFRHRYTPGSSAGRLPTAAGPTGNHPSAGRC